MTGAEHYREAEELIGYAKNFEDDPQASASLLAQAQVHATLALAQVVGRVARFPVDLNQRGA